MGITSILRRAGVRRLGFRRVMPRCMQTIAQCGSGRRSGGVPQPFPKHPGSPGGSAGDLL